MISSLEGWLPREDPPELSMKLIVKELLSEIE